MRKLWWFGIMLGPGLAWASEPVHPCFRSPAEAARITSGLSVGEGLSVDSRIAQDAVNGAQTFRLESVRRDVLLGRSWAMVRSCEHPERPAVVVEMLRQAGEEDRRVEREGRGQTRTAAQTQARAEAPVLVAGSRVQVVRTEQNVRLTMLAVAERSAAVGEWVRLRVLREAGESEEFVEGVVRGAGLVEMGVSR